MSELSDFLDKHDACEFGYVMLARYKFETLPEAYDRSELLGCLFLYHKSGKANAQAYFDFADFIVNHYLQDESELAARHLLKKEIAEGRLLANLSAAWNDRLAAQIKGNKQHSSHLEKTEKLRQHVARNLVYFIQNYLHQVKFSTFNLQFSFTLAQSFRVYASNPFDPQAPSLPQQGCPLHHR